ncbi:MAG: methionine--tRNA ligase [Candidatus Chisholmbacteria bacterium]|nr:methionine--tRNA ligase [Candidatus Chisholmbacteria bacterium]
MSRKNYFYITTTTPYVNADPHIGFALEIVTADVISRYQRMLGKEVRFNTGTDEHGLKIYRQAQEEGLEPKEFVDKNSIKFRKLKDLLNLSFTNFIRTTNPAHKRAAQEFWRRCDANGDIYKATYKIKYCVGCELEKTDSELEGGRCPLHPNKPLEVFDEENYFFRFSRYQERLLKLYRDNPDFVKPEGKYKEIVALVKGGLKDFSISRLKSKLPWGVPVPGDKDQVMFVWFDALINYISTLGWPEDEKNFKAFWPGVQIAGKDNLRQQSAMWQAMLFSAGLPNSKQILINGFISVAGQKMSKSLGNVIAPKDLVGRFGVDGSRYLLMGLGPVHTDMDVTWEKLNNSYTADLANGLGNVVARVAKLAEQSDFTFAQDDPTVLRPAVEKQLQQYRFDLALFEIWQRIREVDKKIEEAKPWELSGTKLRVTLTELVAHLRQIGFELTPFMPETAEKILEQFRGPKIKAGKPLFPRVS